MSDWVVNSYSEFVPSFRVPVLPLPYGVEVERFVPSNRPKTLDVLLYFKYRHPSLLEIARAGLRDRGLDFEEVSYGSYREEEYVEKLGRARTVLWIGCHESQGFALQEAMSCDVPLLL